MYMTGEVAILNFLVLKFYSMYILIKIAHMIPNPPEGPLSFI